MKRRAKTQLAKPLPAEKRIAVFLEMLQEENAQGLVDRLLAEEPCCATLIDLVTSSEPQHQRAVEPFFRLIQSHLKPAALDHFIKEAGHLDTGYSLSLHLLQCQTVEPLRVLLSLPQLNHTQEDLSSAFQHIFWRWRVQKDHFPSLLRAMLTLYPADDLQKMNLCEDSLIKGQKVTTQLARALKHTLSTSVGYTELIASHVLELHPQLARQTHDQAGDLLGLCLTTGFHRLLLALPPDLEPGNYSSFLRTCCQVVNDKKVLEVVFTLPVVGPKLYALLGDVQLFADWKLSELVLEIQRDVRQCGNSYDSWSRVTRARLFAPITRLHELVAGSTPEEWSQESTQQALRDIFELCSSYFSPVVHYGAFSRDGLNLMQACLLRCTKEKPEFHCVKLPPDVTPWMCMTTEDLLEAAQVANPEAARKVTTWLVTRDGASKFVEAQGL